MPSETIDAHIKVIAQAYAERPEVSAVVLAGSQVSDDQDVLSDIDLYVYINSSLPDSARREIAQRFGSEPSIGNDFWEPGDDWQLKGSQFLIDVTFRSQPWLKDQLERVLIRYEAHLGYSTCFWYNVLNSRVLYDPGGFFRDWQSWANQTYPEGLRRSIVSKNLSVLGNIRFSYILQLEKAIARKDLVSANHRVTAFLASYFDVVFALNRLPHPGEKRLVATATRTCKMLPAGMTADVSELCSAPASMAAPTVLRRLENGLSQLAREEGLL